MNSASEDDANMQFQSLDESSAVQSRLNYYYARWGAS